MAVDNDVTITNSATSKTVYLRGVRNLENSKSQPVLSIPFVDTTPANTLLFRFFGQSERVNVAFLIFDDGADVANGTHSSPVITVDEQIVYLRDVIFSDEFDTSWTIGNDRYYSTPVTVVITDLKINSEGGKPSFATGSILVQRGRITALE